MVLVESIVTGMKSQGKSGVWIFIRHPCSLFSGQALVQSLKESANLVFVTTSARYGCFAKVQGRASCRFFFIQFIIFGYVPGEALCEEVKLKTLVHMEAKPLVDEPPGAP